MGRRAKGPRLWLREARIDDDGNHVRSAVWLILDGTRQISTGCGLEDRAGAENELMRYMERQPVSQISYVYFVTTEFPNFPIKIGMSSSHKMRMTTLQVALPYRIKVLAVVPTYDVTFERRIHRKFANTRLCGEWFEPSSELLEFISNLVESRRAA